MAGLVPPQVDKAARDEKIWFEKEILGGPTHLVNRYNIQTYPLGGIRLTFAEQYSSDVEVPPTFRFAAYLDQLTLTTLTQALVNSLPPGTIQLPLQPNTGAKETTLDEPLPIASK